MDTAARPNPAAPLAAAPCSAAPVGEQIRQWRARRRLSQMDLALDTEVSARHLSFVENGRALPSRQMLLRLAEALAIPLRERNGLLLAAGYAPLYRERPLADPGMDSARRAVSLILKGHSPYPAVAVNSRWELLEANAPALQLMAGVDAALLAPPLNVLRLSLDPRGFAPRILNLSRWRAHVLARLRQQIEVSDDGALAALLQELQALPAPDAATIAAARGVPLHELPPEDEADTDDLAGVAIPLRLHTPGGVLSFISTTTVFGTPLDITLSELALETFFPADEFTAQALTALAAQPGAPAAST